MNCILKPVFASLGSETSINSIILGVTGQKKEREEKERKSITKKNKESCLSERKSRRKKENSNIVESSDEFNCRIGTVKNLRMQFEGKEDCKDRVIVERKEVAAKEGHEKVEKSAELFQIGTSRILSSLATSGQGSEANLSLISNGPIGRQDFGGKFGARPKNQVSFESDNRGSKHVNF